MKSNSHCTIVSNLGRINRVPSLLGFAASLLLTLAPARVAAKTLIAEPVQGEKIRIDGELREWPARMTDLSEVVRGSGLRASAVVGYDDKNVYLALKVADTRIARTKAAGKHEDHATLALAFPKGGGYVTYQIDVHPGKPGKLPAVVRVNGKTAAGAKAVENPTESDLLIEAQIPWSVFPEASKTRVGLRAAVRYTNADAPGSTKSIVSTSRGSTGKGLGALLLEGEQGLGTLLRDKGLSSVPAREAYGNLTGDGMLERVAVFGPYLTISGPSFRGGQEIYFAELGVSGPEMVRRLTLTDVDGDGRDEVVIEKRIGSSESYRGILEIFEIGKDDSPFPAFAHEVAIKTEEGSIQNKVTIKAGILEISQGEAEGFEPDTYDEVLPSNMPSALLPWESVGTRRYKWQSGTFVKADEQTWQPKQASKKGAPRKKGSIAASSTPERRSPPPPRPPSADELMDRVYALYKKDRGVSRSKPRFDFVTDVAGDDGNERVLIHDKDIVVFGKGFRNGTSYAFISVGVSDSKDILDASARDVTGDGKAEIILRAVMRAKASKALGGDTIDRHAFLVYAIRGDGLVRIFGAETGRALGKNRILGTVGLQPGNRGVTVSLGPGRTIGWTEDSYPFPPDTTTAGGLEPLLLPWSSGKRTYRYDGNKFVLQ